MPQGRVAKANVEPVRQRTQYSCMACSMMMCLQANGIPDLDEDTVNRVMGAAPMKGAAWEQALACAQHFGMRATLTVPATIRQLKAWTDRGVPVMIAWNPEGRDWSHASMVYDVTEGLDASAVPSSATVEGEGPGLFVWVADPNIPHPEKTTRIVHEDLFYKRWFEKWPNYLVRRPAMAVEREITADGRQVVASQKSAAPGPGGQELYFNYHLTTANEDPGVLKVYVSFGPRGLSLPLRPVRHRGVLMSDVITRQRLTWTRMASTEREAAGPSGLYGYTKAVQASCESASRRVAKHALAIAKRAYEKDPEVVAFLQTHAKREGSRSAKVLLAAMREIGPKVASVQTREAGAAEYGLYGFKARTADLGIQSCGELRAAVGRVAAELHRRRADLHEKITGFLKEHSKQAKCAYSGMLLACYPDADAKITTAAEQPAAPAPKKGKEAAKAPTSVGGWLEWED